MVPQLSVSRNVAAAAPGLRVANAVRPRAGLKVRVRTPGLPSWYAGVMEHFIPGEACILVRERFRVDAPICVEVHGFEFTGTVAFCEPKEDMFEIHIVLANVDEEGRRRDARYVVNLPARVYASLADAPVNGVLVDISREGLGLESPLDLEVGDTVAVESQSNLAFGIVRHSRALAGGIYRVGLLVHNVIIKEVKPESSEKRSWVRSFLSGRTSE